MCPIKYLAITGTYARPKGKFPISYVPCTVKNFFLLAKTGKGGKTQARFTRIRAGFVRISSNHANPRKCLFLHVFLPTGGFYLVL